MPPAPEPVVGGLADPMTRLSRAAAVPPVPVGLRHGHESLHPDRRFRGPLGVRR